MTEDLTDLDNEYAETETEERNSYGPMMPDGPQQALLVELEVRRRQSDDHRQLYMKFRNVRGEVRDWRDLDAENGTGLKIAKGDLKLFGFEGTKLSELPAWLESGAWHGTVCNINKKTKPGDTRDFVDVYVNGKVGMTDNPEMFDIDPRAFQTPAAGRAGAPAAATYEDDDIPF